MGIVNAAVKNIIGDHEEHSEAKIREQLMLIVCGNQWIAEAIRDFPSTEDQRIFLRRSVLSSREMIVRDRFDSVVGGYEESMLDIVITLTVLSFINRFGVGGLELCRSTISILNSRHSFDAIGTRPEIDSKKIITVAVASLVLADLLHDPRGGWKHENYRLIVRSAESIEGRWESLIPILPELTARKTLDPSIIDVLLNATTKSLTSGEL